MANQSNNKHWWAFVVLGAAVGLFVAYSTNVSANEDEASTLVRADGGAGMMTRTYNAADGYAMMTQYQTEGPRWRAKSSNNPTGPDVDIKGFYLDKANVLAQLDIIDTSKVIVGYYIIPGKTSLGNNLMFLGVYEDGTGKRINFPPNATVTGYVYDYIEICPAHCPAVSGAGYTNDLARLGRLNWQ